ncbi:MAG: D-cysteine desulfhydrase family protein [Planctomycetota bacterium]|jgi:D-cysteine desulfhydrase family pyridoxal phosphate-dependent enzyme|nr:D-cysteine desulfhydrase family protein [Planctomycetota bacterium]
MPISETGVDSATTKALHQAIEKLPRVKLADLPTPLHECPRFSEAIGQVRILIKRDDLTGLAFGGNKTRMFDFVFGEAVKQGADTVITGAASQSNHARQAAASAAKLGMAAYLVCRRDEKSKQGIQGNQLLDHILGANVRLCEGSQQPEKERLREELLSQGKKPYLIGGHDQLLATAAYVNCVLEMQNQLDEIAAEPDFIVAASSSSTLAGLGLGAKLLELKGRPVGFRPSLGDNSRVLDHLADIANRTAELLGLESNMSPDDWENTDAYVGENYGIITQACVDAVQLLARTEGILVDPVYVGKALSGLIDFVRQAKFPAGSTVVFVHTGGLPALFAYHQELVEFGGYEDCIVPGNSS